MDRDAPRSGSVLLPRPRPQPQQGAGESPEPRLAAAESLPLTVIEAESPHVKVELRELWRARDTALVFAWRDVKVRYKQSLMGFAWAVLQPLLTMVVFSYIFGHFARIPTQGLVAPVFFYLGLLPWTFFSTALTQISTSVLSNRQLVQKVYFPRLILPLSGLLVPAVDFLCSCTVLAGIIAVFGVGVRPTIVLAPLFLLLLAVTALGVGAVFAAVNVRYRDVPYVVPFVISIWMYLSPVIYGSATLPNKWQVLSALNPVSLAITGFRWAIGGTPAPLTIQYELGLPIAALLLIFGVWFYRHWESRFADTL